MNRRFLIITLIILVVFLAGCALYSQQPKAEITEVISNNIPSPAIVVTPQSSPTLPSSPTPQATFTQVPQPEAPPSPSQMITVTVASGIPSVIDQIHLGVPPVDVLADPSSNRLYVIDTQGKLRFWELTDHKQITDLKTAFQAVDGYVYSSNSYSGKVLAVDPQRNRLYVSGSPILIVDTVSLTVTERLSLSGQITPDPTSNRVYFTPRNSDETDCGTQILNVETWEGLDVLYPRGAKEPPPLMGPCIWSTHLDAENHILYATGRICSGGSSCGLLTVSIFDVSETPQYIANVNEAIALDTVDNRVFVWDEVGYKDYRLRRFEIQGQTLTRTLDLPEPDYRRKMFYDPTYDRLYSDNSIFDGDLSLISKTNLPGSLLAFDSKNQHLYSGDEDGDLYIISTGFGPK